MLTKFAVGGRNHRRAKVVTPPDGVRFTSVWCVVVTERNPCGLVGKVPAVDGS